MMFKVNKYNLSTNKNINIKIALLADIHYSEEFSFYLEEQIIKKIKEEKLDYICLSGDIIDTYKFLEKTKNIERLKSFVERLGNITKTFIIFGSHDLEDVRRPIDDFSKSIKTWKNIFKGSKNIKILDNDVYSDEKVCIAGITLPSSYYHKSPIENKKILSNLLEHLNYKYDNKYNILLIHSPRRVFDNIKYLKDIDLVLCGHMHDGVVPKFLKWLPGSIGIVGPSLTILPKYSRGIIKKDNNVLIVTGGITKFGPSHLKRRKLISKLYNNEMEVINIRGKYE